MAWDSDEFSVSIVSCVDSEYLVVELSVTELNVVAVTWVSDGDTVSEEMRVVLGCVCAVCGVSDVGGRLSKVDVVIEDSSDIGWVCVEV